MPLQNYPLIRVTGVLIEQQSVLLEKQVLRERSHWTLPGGQLEFGETLEQCLVREMHEETGLEVEIKDLLYLCDRFRSLDHHVIDISFLVRRTGGQLYGSSFSDGGLEHISKLRMVPFSCMVELGFSGKFIRLLENGLPEKGSYQGEFHAFYG